MKKINIITLMASMSILAFNTYGALEFIDFEDPVLVVGSAVPENYGGFIWNGWTVREEELPDNTFNKFVYGAPNATISRVDNLSFSFDSAAFIGSLTIKDVSDPINTSEWTTFGTAQSPIIAGVDTLVFSSTLGFKMDNFADAPIPEPTTMVAGVLLLLPFGFSALRILRKK